MRLFAVERGDGAAGRVVKDSRAWDPDANAMARVAVAQYGFDAAGRLTSVFDPRISPALKTTYTYDLTWAMFGVLGVV